MATIQPGLIRWAIERGSMTADELAPKVGTAKNPAPVAEWEKAEGPLEIPISQLEKFAKATRAPFAMLFLPEAPAEPLPIKDFRGVSGRQKRPSLDLLETIYQNQLSQQWLSEALREDGEEPVPFVGSVSLRDSVTVVADSIRATLGIGTLERRRVPTTTDLVLWMMGRCEEVGITVIRKGYAGTNTKRTLDPSEFKGFALADPYAPLICVNGKDWQASQLFTLVHECVHLWLGESAIPDGDWSNAATDPTEVFCNRVTSEVFMPPSEVLDLWDQTVAARENVDAGADHFRVSRLSFVFRARNLGLITPSELSDIRSSLESDFRDGQGSEKGKGGGNFYNNQGVHLGKRFLREVLMRTLEGRTLYSEAFELLGTKRTSVVKEMARRYL